jgi:large repetitive protein
MSRRSLLENLETRRLFNGQPMLFIEDAYLNEGNAGSTNAAIVVSLNKSRGNQSVTVNYATQDGAGTAGSDYTAVSGKLTFGPGQTSKTILVPILGDRTPEANEYFYLNLSSPRNAKLADSQAYVSIYDDEPRVYISSASANEGNAGNSPLNFTASLYYAYDEDVTVQYTTANGDALAGSDYSAASGTLTIPAGQTSATLAVSVLGDKTVESNEYFVLNLSNASPNAELMTAQTTGTIIDDEPRLSISDAYQEYNGATFTFTVSLTAASTDIVTVDFATQSGTAQPGVDYIAKSGTLTFAPGETSKTIVVDIVDPTSYSDKYFSISLSNATNAPLATTTAYGYWYYYYDPGYYDPGYYDPGYWWYYY